MSEERSSHRTMLPCRHCKLPFVAGEHWPQGTIAYHNGEPYGWHEYEPNVEGKGEA